LLFRGQTLNFLYENANNNQGQGEPQLLDAYLRAFKKIPKADQAGINAAISRLAGLIGNPTSTFWRQRQKTSSRHLRNSR